MDQITETLACIVQGGELRLLAVAGALGLSERMARLLLKAWVADGWIIIANPSNRKRAYALSENYRQYVGNLPVMPGGKGP